MRRGELLGTPRNPSARATRFIRVRRKHSGMPTQKSIARIADSVTVASSREGPGSSGDEREAPLDCMRHERFPGHPEKYG
jgi:hypothetical protein